MGSIISAIADDEDTYEALCKHYGERSDGGPYGEHAKKLQARRVKDLKDERRVAEGKSPSAKLSDAELKAELKRREKEREDDELRPNENPDFTKLIRCVTEGVERERRERQEPKDFAHWIMEEAIKALYGDRYSKWRRRQKF